MTKIIVPVESAENGGPLYTFVDDLSNLNSEVSKKREGDNLIIDDSGASSEQKLELDEATILSILAEGGDVEGYVFGIKAPLSSSNVDVPVGLPIRANVNNETRTFKDWFVPQSAEIWKNTVTSEFIYYNNPNPSGLPYLLASEAELIRQIDTDNYSFMTVAEVAIEVALPNWVKL